MVKLNRIYTRSGDDGTSGLVDGSRVAKNALRMQAIGDVDEANSQLGVALAALSDPARIEPLRRVQNELFDLGADLATPEGVEGALRILPEQVTRLEEEIDAMNEGLEPLASFVLPGGSPATAHLYLARAVVRRAERKAVALAADEGVNEAAIAYLNRLSDHLFVAARSLAADGDGDILWQPGATRN